MNTTTSEMPCVEIIGLGSLTAVGLRAVQLADGPQFDNRMCVPGFHSSNFNCRSTLTLIQDTGDLNQNGHTQESIADTSAMQSQTAAAVE